MRIQHSFYHRLMWNPFVVALPFAFLAYTAYLSGFPIGRTAAAGLVAIWFAMSVCDALTGHRLLDWMYSNDGSDTPDSGDFEFVDSYLHQWDQFAQGANELVPTLRDNKESFETALARMLTAKDKRAPSRLVFYAVVQVGGFIPLHSDLGKAAGDFLGPDFPVFTSEDETRAYFAGELYFWWLENRDKYAAFPLFDEWSQREFARSVVIPMYESTRGRK